MLFSIRIFTATLGRKNSLTRRQVFPNVAVKADCGILLENILHYIVCFCVDSVLRTLLLRRKCGRLHSFCTQFCGIFGAELDGLQTESIGYLAQHHTIRLQHIGTTR